jgi:c-di-GMP-binding flagellar brake protein YcgR
MFFRKKKTESFPETTAKAPNSGPVNKRKYYRVRPRATQVIRASLERESAQPIGGDCLDLSIGGAWVRFDATHDPMLKKGDVCSLRIRADSQPDSVRATCRVAAVLPLDKGRTRVGFQFTNRIELYAQLDEFYARLFNRRRHVRLTSDYDVRIPVKLAWRGGSLPAIAHDISEGGLGIMIALDKANSLERVAEVDVTFRLPRERVEIVCRALIKSRTNFANNCLVGIEFTPEGGIENHITAVRRCIEKRLAAAEAWNSKLGKRVLSKRSA